LDRTFARLNIEHFRKKLAEEADPDRRATLLQLIAEAIDCSENRAVNS